VEERRWLDVEDGSSPLAATRNPLRLQMMGFCLRLEGDRNVAVRRTMSSPELGAMAAATPLDVWIGENDAGSDEEEVELVSVAQRGPVSDSLGIPLSPRGWARRFRDYSAALETGAELTGPMVLDASVINYANGGWTGYIMVNYPIAAGQVFRDVSRIHTTLLRLRPLPGDSASWLTAQGWLDEMQTNVLPLVLPFFLSSLHALRGVEAYRVEGSEHLRLVLAPAPWVGSWTFGLEEHLRAILEAVRQQLIFLMMIRKVRTRFLLPHRPIHVSWE